MGDADASSTPVWLPMEKLIASIDLDIEKGWTEPTAALEDVARRLRLFGEHVERESGPR